MCLGGTLANTLESAYIHTRYTIFSLYAYSILTSPHLKILHCMHATTLTVDCIKGTLKRRGRGGGKIDLKFQEDNVNFYKVRSSKRGGGGGKFSASGRPVA